MASVINASVLQLLGVGSTSVANARQAACIGADDDLFFPKDDDAPDPDKAAAAKAICARCPLRAACLSEALARNEAHGIWGGTTVAERAAILAVHPEAVALRSCHGPGCSVALTNNPKGLYCSPACRLRSFRSHKAQRIAAAVDKGAA